MKKIHIPLEDRAYDIFIGSSLMTSQDYDGLRPFVKNRSCFIVTDSNVDKLYGDTVHGILEKIGARSMEKYVFDAGERSKNLDTVRSLYSSALEVGVDRSSVVIAVGGGVVGDTAGFLAATYMRGIDYVQIPTSLIAQVDSSVGGKTGVDLPHGKNLVGAFHQPKAVLIDISTLKSLSPRQLRCGLAEVVKYGVILDEEFFEFLEANVDELLKSDPSIYEEVVYRCCSLKANVVLNDEYDQGNRAILNYGHTFGHALEKLAGYEGMTHGEAIAAGMGIAADLALLINDTRKLAELVERQDNLFGALDLPTNITGHSPDDILAAMQTDKKFVKGKIRLILPEVLGSVNIVQGISDELILNAIKGRCG